MCAAPWASDSPARTPRARVVVDGRSLAGEVGQEHQALGTHRDREGRVDAARPPAVGSPGASTPSDPVHRLADGVHRAAVQPQPGQTRRVPGTCPGRPPPGPSRRPGRPPCRPRRPRHPARPGPRHGSSQGHRCHPRRPGVPAGMPSSAAGPGSRLPTTVPHSTARPNRAGSPPPPGARRRWGGATPAAPTRPISAREAAGEPVPRATGTPAPGRAASGSWRGEPALVGQRAQLPDRHPDGVPRARRRSTDARVSSQVMAGARVRPRRIHGDGRRALARRPRCPPAARPYPHRMPRAPAGPPPRWPAHQSAGSCSASAPSALGRVASYGPAHGARPSSPMQAAP